MEKAESKNVVQFPASLKTKNPAAALGKLGGSKGGKIRAARLSPEQRAAIAANAAKARSVTPAMEAKITDHVWDLEELLA
jgi:hypothetical protein